jgi:hypothetical protein
MAGPAEPAELHQRSRASGISYYVAWIPGFVIRTSEFGFAARIAAAINRL